MYTIFSLGTFRSLAPRCGFQRSVPEDLSGEPAACFCAPVFAGVADVDPGGPGGFKDVLAHHNLVIPREKDKLNLWSCSIRENPPDR